MSLYKKTLTFFISLLILSMFSNLSFPFVYAEEVTVDSYAIGNYDSVSSLKKLFSAFDEDVAGGRGQAFTGDGSVLLACKFYLQKVVSPSGNLIVKVYSVGSGTYGSNAIPAGSSGSPPTALAVSNTISISGLSTSISLVMFNFTGINQITLETGTKYCLSLQVDSGTVDNTNYVNVGRDGSSPSHSGNYFLNIGSGSGWYWSGGATSDTIFYVYGLVAQASNFYPTNVDETSHEYGYSTVLYSLWENYFEEVELDGYIFSWNATGSFDNETWTEFSGTNQSWANVTKMLVYEIGTIVQWLYYANDTANIWNITETQTFTIVLTNSIITTGAFETTKERHTSCTFYSYWWSRNIECSGFIFSWDVGEGYVNDTWQAFPSTNETWGNVTKALDYILGTEINYIFYANSSINTWNTTDVETLTVQATITFYFNTGGTFNVNGVEKENTTSTVYTSPETLTLTALSSYNYTYIGFFWDYDATTNNPYNFDVENQTDLWCYFSELLQPYIIARFTFTPSNPEPEEEVWFNASLSVSNEEITNYIFYFGDEFSTGWQTSSTTFHEYAEAGSYQVMVGANGTAGTAYFNQTVVVGYKQTPFICAVFEWNIPNPEINQLVEFNATLSHSSSTITDYEWNFGDGNTTNSIDYILITHQYLINDTYTISLTVTSEVGTATIRSYLVVGWGENVTTGGATPYIGASFTFSPANAAINELILFNGSMSISSEEILNFTWNFGDTNITSGNYPTIYHSYSTNGTFYIILTVENDIGSASVTIPYYMGETSPFLISKSFVLALGILLCIILIPLSIFIFIRRRQKT